MKLGDGVALSILGELRGIRQNPITLVEEGLVRCQTWIGVGIGFRPVEYEVWVPLQLIQPLQEKEKT